MTTYIFGAGASVHAGYPLTKALWPRLVAYAHSEIASSTMLRAIETIRALYGPVSDIEATLTALDRGDAGFQDLKAEERGHVAGGVRGTIAALFHYIRLEIGEQTTTGFPMLFCQGTQLSRSTTM